eukprot:symbB.v1.2.009012.t1/scaffold564.1/size186654/6
MGKVKNWVTQLCMALKHVHNLRIVHRDVKGSNMFITGAQNIVLGDFGVSKQLTESQQKAMTSVGSPMYMAPEWWDGRGGTANSDMWSVGVVLYELLALRRPFEAQNVLSLVHKITTEEPAALEDADPQLSRLALELLNKRPEKRPSAAQALESKGLEDAEKILQIYREALEKKSDRRQHRLAREEDVAAGRKPRRPSRSTSMSSEYESSGNVAGLRAVNLVEIARRQASAAPATVDEAEGSSEDEDEEESSSWGADSSEEEDEEAPLEVDSDASQDSWNGVAVEIQDTQSLSDVLAGVKQTSGNVKPPPCGALDSWPGWTCMRIWTTVASECKAAWGGNGGWRDVNPNTPGLKSLTAKCLLLAMSVMDVAVLNLSGRYFHFQVNAEQSAADLKSLVAMSWKVPHMCLKLSVEMRVVEDDEIVASLCESGKPLEVSALVVSEKLYDAIENGRLVERAAALAALPQIALPGDGRALADRLLDAVVFFLGGMLHIRVRQDRGHENSC